MTLLALTNLTVTRNTCPVVDNISLNVSEGECIGLIGPNGAGKTTLMRAALGLLPFTGKSSLAELGASDRAKACVWLPQNREIAWPISVETLITLGRLPHLDVYSKLSTLDQAAIECAMARMNLLAHRNRIATQMSGGEQARVLIARALAQETQLLLADEPTSGLDPAGQIATMEVFANLAAEGRGVIASLHDLGLAARHCTRLILLSVGRVIADGSPNEVLTAQNLEQVFGVSAHFSMTEHGPVFQPLEVLQNHSLYSSDTP